jgi:preprotein translocase subunit SecF
MFDNIYSKLIEKVPYRTLIFIPIVLSILALIVVLVNGLPLGIDFKGGTLIEVTTDNPLGQASLDSISKDLSAVGLKDLKVYEGSDIETRKNKVSIETTSVATFNETSAALQKYTGALRTNDVATVSLQSPPPSDLDQRLTVRLRQGVDVSYDNTSKILTLVSIDMDKTDLENALKDFIGPGLQVNLDKRNMNIDAMQPTLGEKLKTDGLKAAVIGYILMALVIFIAFRNFVPSMAVLLSATSDGLITLGGMSLLGIVLEPASLVALLMLVGYSVDTDVLLASRILKRRKGDVNEGVDSAIKTGLTMTGTTFVVMIVVLVISTLVTHVSTLSSIASVLLLGLVADVCSTWFMNAGILKWYIEEKRSKLKKARSSQTA